MPSSTTFSHDFSIKERKILSAVKTDKKVLYESFFMDFRVRNFWEDKNTKRFDM